MPPNVTRLAAQLVDYYGFGTADVCFASRSSS